MGQTHQNAPTSTTLLHPARWSAKVLHAWRTIGQESGMEDGV
jgi:hypothetical protein